MCCLAVEPYDAWSDLWPKAPSSPMADRLNSAIKYVLTHRPDRLEWGPFEAIGPNLVEGVRRIKSQDGPDLILWGSSTLTSLLIKHGLAEWKAITEAALKASGRVVPITILRGASIHRVCWRR